MTRAVHEARRLQSDHQAKVVQLFAQDAYDRWCRDARSRQPESASPVLQELGVNPGALQAEATSGPEGFETEPRFSACTTHNVQLVNGRVEAALRATNVEDPADADLVFGFSEASVGFLQRTTRRGHCV